MPEKRSSREAEEHFLKTPEKLLQTAEGEPRLRRNGCFRTEAGSADLSEGVARSDRAQLERSSTDRLITRRGCAGLLATAGKGSGPATGDHELRAEIAKLKAKIKNREKP